MNVTYIERSPGNWRLRVEIGRDAAGKRQFSYETVRGTEDDAQRRRFAILQSIAERTWAEPSTLTVGAFLTRWVSDRQALGIITQSSAEMYARMLSGQVIRRIGGIRLQKLTGGDVQGAYAAMLSGPHAIKASTAITIHRILRTAFKDARRLRLIVANPMDEVTAPRNRTVRGAEKAVEAVDAARILAYVVGMPQEDVIKLALGTGMRRGELCGLQWGNIDLARARVNVTHQIVQYNEGWARKEPKTARGRRRVSLPPEAVEMLQARRARAATEALATGAGSIDETYVFTRPDGVTPLLPTGLTSMFRVICDKLGLPEFTFHGLRHTHITDLLRKGADPTAVSERVGHANVAFTMGVYQSVFDEDRDKLADLASGLLRRRGT